MALPRVDLDRWEFKGSTGSLLLFEDKLFRQQYKLFPAAAVFNGNVGPEAKVLRARSLTANPAAISCIVRQSRAEA